MLNQTLISNTAKHGVRVDAPLNSGVSAVFLILHRAMSFQKEKNMATKIFINLPVKNLNKSVEFFTKLGCSFNVQFTDETAACIIVVEDIKASVL
jgi:hypothetical protein